MVKNNNTIEVLRNGVVIHHLQTNYSGTGECVKRDSDTCLFMDVKDNNTHIEGVSKTKRG